MLLNLIKTGIKYLAPLAPLVPKFIGMVKNLFTSESKELSKENMSNNGSIINITEELQKFNENLKTEFLEIEKNIIVKIEEQLSQYIEIAETLEKYPQIKKNTIEKIKREIKKYKNVLDGQLLNELRKNISIDNNYLVKILKMENSPTKEKMIEDFISKSTKKSLENYSAKILEDLKDISENILDEFNCLIEEFEDRVKTELEELKELEKSSENSIEKERMICSKVLEKVMLESI